MDHETFKEPKLTRTNLELDFQKLFQALDTPLTVLDRDFNIIASNEARIKVTGISVEQSYGRNIFDVFPDNPKDPSAKSVESLRASLNRVLKTKAADKMAIQKYDIPVPGSTTGAFEERFWRPINIPVLDEQQDVSHIIHKVEDVTDEVLSERRQKVIQSGAFDE